MAHDVFISHSSKDKVCADALCATSEKHNIRCWVAPRDILPGSDYGSAILEGIKASKVMILIFSSNSNESAHVKREVERAVNHGIIIVPFKIEDVALSSTMEYFVSGTHWLDAIEPPFENHLKSVTEHMCLLLSKPIPLWEQVTVVTGSELPLGSSQIVPISVGLTEDVLVNDAPLSVPLKKAARLEKDRLKKDRLETISALNSLLIYSLSDLEYEVKKYRNIDAILAPIKLEIEKWDAYKKNKQDIEKSIYDIRNVFSDVKFLLKNIDNIFDKIKIEDLNDIEIEGWVNKLNQSSDIYLEESVNAIVSYHDELSSILSNVNDFFRSKTDHIKKDKLEKERLKKEKLEKERLKNKRLEKERLKKDLLKKERLERVSALNYFLIDSLNALESETKKYKNIEAILAPVTLQIGKGYASEKKIIEIKKSIIDIKKVFNNVKLLNNKIAVFYKLIDKANSDELGDIKLEELEKKLNDIYLADSINEIIANYEEFNIILLKATNFLKTKIGFIKNIIKKLIYIFIVFGILVSILYIFQMSDEASKNAQQDKSNIGPYYDKAKNTGNYSEGSAALDSKTNNPIIFHNGQWEYVSQKATSTP